jgi:hypothetical protein
MHPSRIATIPADAVTEESGYVVLGTIDGLAYVHLAPFYDPVRVFFPNGDLTRPRVLGPDEPDPDAEGMLAVQESVRPSWAADAVPVFDPSPNPFRWDDFAAAHPDLAATLTPHQWAGE